MPELLPFQRAGVQFLSSRKVSLLADDMGLGKSAQSITVAREAEAGRVLVVCPASVKYSWLNEFQIWWPEAKVAVLSGRQVPQLQAEANVLIINYDVLWESVVRKSPRGYTSRTTKLSPVGRWLAESFDPEIAIVDEAHFLKSPKAHRTKVILGKYSIVQWADKIIFLTGTPMENRPMELYPLLKCCAPDEMRRFTNQWEYGEYFCGGQMAEYKGATNLPELREILSTFMLRRTKEQVLSELPDLWIRPIFVEVAATWSKQETLPEQLHALGMLKVAPTLTYLQELEDAAVEKIVVFAYHREVLEACKDSLGDKAVLFYGGMSAEAKDNAIVQFMHNPRVSVFLGQVKAAGLGINGLQKVANHVVFVESYWSPSVMDQAMDRVRRLGQMAKDVTVDVIIARDSPDELMQKVLRAKRSVIKKTIKESEMTGILEEMAERLRRMEETLSQLVESQQKVEPAPEVEESKPEPAKAEAKKPKAKKAEVVEEPEDPKEITEEQMLTRINEFTGKNMTPDDPRRAVYLSLFKRLRDTIYGGPCRVADLDSTQRIQLYKAIEMPPQEYAASYPDIFAELTAADDAVQGI